MIAALAPNVDQALKCAAMASQSPPRPSRARRWAKRAALALAVLLVALLGGAVVLHQPRPVGTPGPAAEALAHRMVAAVGGDQWEQTGAVEWTLLGHHHLWDRQRGFVQVRRGDLRVLLRTSDQTGVAFRGSEALHGEALRGALDKAWAYFCNDSFWLNPIVKAFDDGTSRSIVRVDGRDALLVEYGAGGVTPGDAYLWILDDDGRPTEWRMWVGVLPVGGVPTPWTDYVTLPTGAQVATQHRYGPLALSIEDLRGAATLADLHSSDPFAALVR